jgi:hypothetical protein
MKRTTLTLIAIGVLFITGLSCCGGGGWGTTPTPGPTTPVKITKIAIPEKFEIKEGDTNEPVITITRSDGTVMRTQDDPLIQCVSANQAVVTVEAGGGCNMTGRGIGDTTVTITVPSVPEVTATSTKILVCRNLQDSNWKIVVAETGDTLSNQIIRQRNCFISSFRGIDLNSIQQGHVIGGTRVDFPPNSEYSSMKVDISQDGKSMTEIATEVASGKTLTITWTRT